MMTWKQLYEHLAFTTYEYRVLDYSEIQDWYWQALIMPLTTGEYAYNLQDVKGCRSYGYEIQGPFASADLAFEAARAEMRWILNGGRTR